jgi:glycosyltransferase involved in cell wall biosynthesis
MRQSATGDYICFIDDDDLVHPQYVSMIYPLLDGVDYIGFDVEQRINGSHRAVAQHSLQFSGVGQDDRRGHWRDISHLNPMLRTLALTEPMMGFPGEDTGWATAMRNLGIVKTEHYIPFILYYYMFDTIKADYDGALLSDTMEVYPWDMKKRKVRMLVNIVGTAMPQFDLDDFGFSSGQTVELHPELAELWINVGKARAIPEATVIAPAETAMLGSPKPRRKVAV